jgi:hypothetical protein
MAVAGNWPALRSVIAARFPGSLDPLTFKYSEPRALARADLQRNSTSAKITTPQLIVKCTGSSAMKRHVIILSYAIVAGTVVTVLTTPLERYRDPFSHVSYRGLPAAVLISKPQWSDGPQWRINIRGVVINVVAWTIPAGLVVGCIFEWRDRKRRRWVAEGRCGKCGYSLFGISSARCPECGTKAEARDVLHTGSTPDQ